MILICGQATCGPCYGPPWCNAKQECNKGSSVYAAVDTHHTLSCATAHPFDASIRGLTQRTYGPTMLSQCRLGRRSPGPAPDPLDRTSPEPPAQVTAARG